MVHVTDLVKIIIHLFHQPGPGGLLNVVDNEPVKQKELYTFFARQLQKIMPLPSTSEPPRKRAFTNKRVSNDRLRKTGYSFIYPTFREGYESEIRRLRTATI
jgi:nucleoside-diphosphate-sugar epimerase